MAIHVAHVGKFLHYFSIWVNLIPILLIYFNNVNQRRESITAHLVLLFAVTANAEMPVEPEGLHLIGCSTYEWDFTYGAIVQFQVQTLREIGRLDGEYGTRPLYAQYITRLTQRAFPPTATWGSLPIYVNDLKGSWKRSFSPFASSAWFPKPSVLSL